MKIYDQNLDAIRLMTEWLIYATKLNVSAFIVACDCKQLEAVLM